MSMFVRVVLANKTIERLQGLVFQTQQKTRIPKHTSHLNTAVQQKLYAFELYKVSRSAFSILSSKFIRGFSNYWGAGFFPPFPLCVRLNWLRA